MNILESIFCINIIKMMNNNIYNELRNNCNELKFDEVKKILDDLDYKKKYFINTLLRNYSFIGFYPAIEWLFNNLPLNNDILEECFIYACSNGHINICKLLINSDIDVHKFGELPFRWSCKNGHLDIAKWMLNTFPDTNVNIYNNINFIYVCVFEKYDVLDWLLTLINIDDITNNENLYVQLFKHGKISMFEYLKTKIHLDEYLFMNSIINISNKYNRKDSIQYLEGKYNLKNALK
jgi:hypothetical protein